MYFSTAVTSTLLLASGAVAQMAGTMTSSMSTPNPATEAGATVNVHVVTVSDPTGKKLQFSPNNIQAKMGEMVQFQFTGGNHTVTQAAFASPCVPINNVMSNTTGFFSGFQAVASGSTQLPTFTMMINTTSPIWFYCSQGKHCQSGMVGAINAAQNGSKTIQAFAALAANATSNSAPGSSSSGSSSNSTSSGGSSSGSGTGSGSGSTSTPPPASSSSPAISTGAASGSVWASSRELYAGASVAGLVAAFMMML